MSAVEHATFVIERMLPAIYFIFSRNACTEAADACVAAGLRLTTADERDRGRHVVGHTPLDTEMPHVQAHH